MKKYFKIIILLCCLLPCLSIAKLAPPSTEPYVNLNQYMGTWYEIASFPNWFQRGCQCTTAHYTLKKNKVKILNQCYKGKDLKKSSAKGTGWSVSENQNSKLKVRFFWPFKGDYWILYLSPGYKQAIVGSPNRRYLWLLSRTPTLDSKTLNHLISIAKNKHYDTDKLNMTYQGCKQD